MLISHRKRFIFTKTAKTAGTSVESFFEQYCMPAGEWRESHARDEYVSEAGIIGARGPGSVGRSWFNHMSAQAMREQIGAETWDAYFKFTVVRNPFDKMISGFHMMEKRKLAYTPLQKLKAVAKRVLDRGGPIDRVTGATDIERFRSWVAKGGAIPDNDKFLIDGKVCVDFFIRFEQLHDDIRQVCERLAIPFDPSFLPEFKKGMRHHQIAVRDYYDAATEAAVRRLYAWEFERFGYRMPE
jgi:hypothetical protein